jgi:hypothetical protein
MDHLRGDKVKVPRLHLSPLIAHAKIPFPLDYDPCLLMGVRVIFDLGALNQIHIGKHDPLPTRYPDLHARDDFSCLQLT